MASIIYPNSYAEAWLEPTHVSRVAPEGPLEGLSTDWATAPRQINPN